MNAGDHTHTVDEEARNREAALDRTIEDSFPASDPPSSIPNPDDDRQDLLEHVDERHGQGRQPQVTGVSGRIRGRATGS